MRSYTEVSPGISRNWEKFGGTVKGNPGTAKGNPGTVWGNPGTIWGNPGTIWDNPGTIWGCHLADTLSVQISHIQWVFAHLSTKISMKNRNSLKCNPVIFRGATT